MKSDKGKLTFFRLYSIIHQSLSIWYLITNKNARGIWFYFVGTTLFLSICLVILSYLRSDKFIIRFSPKIPSWVAYSLTVLLSISFGILPFATPFQLFLYPSGRLLFLLWAVGFSTLLFQFSSKKPHVFKTFLLCVLMSGFFYKIGSFVPDIRSTPFSLGWSEASRYYNASLFFATRIYSIDVPLPILHPSRYLMQAFPFLLRINQIWFHRLWQVILWIGITALGSFAVLYQLKPGNRYLRTTLFFGLFLFFFQGAVYYHLMVCAILVLIGYNSKKPNQTLCLVILSSIWAGLSRINWYPVPALLAITLYLLETPLKNNWFTYLKKPLIWGISGGLTAFATNQLYIHISNNDPSLFGTSLDSLMIWDRLLPNNTFPLGILPGIIIVSIPTILVISGYLRENWTFLKTQWFRLLGIFSILLVFLVGGVIVSVKVGGGGDLHNLDAFLVFLAIIGVFALKNLSLNNNLVMRPLRSITNLVLFSLVIIPTIFAITSRSGWFVTEPDPEQHNIRIIQNTIDLLSKTKDDVLFISERQLLTFNQIEDVDLNPDYEKVLLMEMVMSNNQSYLDTLYEKINNHSFSVIVVDSIETHLFPEEDAFGIENNLWVEKITLPLLDQYTPVITLNEGEINILIPKSHTESIYLIKEMLRPSY